MRLDTLTTIAALVCLIGPTPQQPATGPAAQAEWVLVSPAPHYVGQAIEIQLRVVDRAKTKECAVGALDLANSESFPLNADSDPGTAARWLVVPRTPGTLKLPARRFRCGDLEYAAPTRSTSIESPPVSGQSRDFLGGVGRLDATASLDREQARVGEWVTVSVTLRGPGALGSRAIPSLTARAGDSSIEIALRTAAVAADPPVRRLEGRVRLPSPGRWVIGSLPVTSYVMETRRYETVRTRGISIDIQPAPTIDVATLGYGGSTAERVPRLLYVLGWVAGIGVAAFSFYRAAWWFKRRPRVSKQSGMTSARAVGALERLAREPGDSSTKAKWVERVITGLLRDEDPVSAALMTRDEAEAAWLARGGGRDQVPNLRARLEDCARLSYSHARSQDEAAQVADLIQQAIRLVQTLRSASQP